ncbi:MAG TPA: caspase family protein [Blastocatellia bacterium]|nr:caspase family protein [Blastocatellia bacterium]
MWKYPISRTALAASLFLALLALRPLQGLGAQDGGRGLKIKVGATNGELTSGRATDINLWAVLIGVSRYQYGDQDLDGNRISNLKHASEDAEAMRDFLMSPEGGGFKEDHIALLEDESATRANVQSALAKLKQAKPSDFFVIYIAAHGAVLPFTDPKTNTTRDIPYFLLYDTDVRNPEKTALRMEAFRQTVDGLEAKKGLVLSDTCYSGGVQLIGRGVDESANANQRYLDLMSKIPEGVGFISAAKQTERSYEKDDFSHGVFTYCLIEGLGGAADANQDGKVTFDEVVQYLDERVPQMTNGRQHPFANTTAVDANYLALSAVTYANLARLGPVSGYGLLKIRVPDIDGVNVAIDEKDQTTLEKGVTRTFRVPAGEHRLRFAKANSTRQWPARVEAGKTYPFTVNFAFSESGSADDSLVDPGELTNVYLPPDVKVPRDAEDLFRQGVDLFNKQDYRKSIEKLNQANDKFDPKAKADGGNYAEALVYRGRAEQSLGMDKEAVKSFQRALQLRPSDFETKTLLAEARFNAVANLDQVERDLRDVIASHPDFAFARVVLADLLLYQNKPRQAEWELRLAINDDPNYPAAYLVLADVLTYQSSQEKQKEATKMAEKALELFKRVSEKKVKFSTGLKNLSISHVIFGHANYANNNVMAEVHHAIAKTRTRYVEFNARKLSAQEKAGYLDSARAELNEALGLAQKLTEKRRLALVLETSAANHFYKAEMQPAIEDGKQALKVAAQYPEMKDLPDAHLTLYGAYKSVQDYAKAAEHLQKYIDVGNVSPEEKANRKQEVQNLLNKARANGQIK